MQHRFEFIPGVEVLYLVDNKTYNIDLLVPSPFLVYLCYFILYFPYFLLEKVNAIIKGYLYYFFCLFQLLKLVIKRKKEPVKLFLLLVVIECNFECERLAF